jgi:hypothetical protein
VDVSLTSSMVSIWSTKENDLVEMTIIFLVNGWSGYRRQQYFLVKGWSGYRRQQYFLVKGWSGYRRQQYFLVKGWSGYRKQQYCEESDDKPIWWKSAATLLLTSDSTQIEVKSR